MRIPVILLLFSNALLGSLFLDELKHSHALAETGVHDSIALGYMMTPKSDDALLLGAGKKIYLNFKQNGDLYINGRYFGNDSLAQEAVRKAVLRAMQGGLDCK